MYLEMSEKLRLKLKIDIAGLHTKVHLKKKTTLPRQHGTGFSILKKIQNTFGNDRTYTLVLEPSSGLINIVNIYGPTLASEQHTKDHFYDELHYVVSGIPGYEKYLQGDFNARVGIDSNLWPV